MFCKEMQLLVNAIPFFPHCVGSFICRNKKISFRHSNILDIDKKGEKLEVLSALSPITYQIKLDHLRCK